MKVPPLKRWFDSPKKPTLFSILPRNWCLEMMGEIAKGTSAVSSRMRGIFLRAGWKYMFCVPDFEKVTSAGEASDWVKKTHCCKSGMEVYFSLVL